MKEITGIKSETRPLEIDDTSSDTTVYVRSNIVTEKSIDPIFNTEKTIYIYNEIQYTLAEWYKIQMNDINMKIEILANCIDKLTDELNTIKATIKNILE